MSHQSVRFYVLGLAISVLTGCGGADSSRPDLIPISGSVLYNGTPVAGATVTFWHAEAPRAATGVTDAEGKYQLTMYEPYDGAIAGENIITVTKVVGGAAPAADPMKMLDDPTAMASAAAAPSKESDKTASKPAIPEKYAAKETTPLKENVSADNDTIPLQLAD